VTHASDWEDHRLDNFFARMPAGTAARIDDLSRLSYELRENRARLLRPYGVADERELQRSIIARERPEHPAYEHYLGACTLRLAREKIRAQWRDVLAGAAMEPPATPLLIELAALLEEQCSAELDGPVRRHQDALLVSLANGVDLEVRFGADDEYAFNWRWGESEWRIDTAPLHPAVATFPHHLHDEAGVLRNDRVTDPARSPWDNLHALIVALIADPRLPRSE
jgi:hypothetical protein